MKPALVSSCITKPLPAWSHCHTRHFKIGDSVFILRSKHQQKNDVIKQQYQHIHSKRLFHKYGFWYNHDIPNLKPKAGIVYRITAIQAIENTVAKTFRFSTVQINDQHAKSTFTFLLKTILHLAPCYMRHAESNQIIQSL